jgi:hypothetical protein
MDRQCQTCCHWSTPIAYHRGTGWCHRYPPTFDDSPARVQSAFPETRENDWCSEWKKKNEAKRGEG